MDSQLIAMTEKLYIPKLVDNVYDTNWTLKKLRAGQRSYDGGRKITPAIEYEEAASAGSFTGLEILDTTVGDISTSADYEWRQYFCTLGWSRRDYLINKSSKARIVDMVSAVTNNASKKLQKLLTTGLFQSSKADTTDIDGLIVAICAAGSTECGGLTSSDFAKWAPVRDTTTTKLTLAAMNSTWRDANDGTDTIDLIVTTDDVLGYFYDISTPLQRYNDSEAAKAGFTSLSFNGTSVVSDKNCTANHLYMLNLSHLWLGVHESENMRYQKPQTPIDQAGDIGQIFWMGNLVCDSRRRQAVMTAITS